MANKVTKAEYEGYKKAVANPMTPAPIKQKLQSIIEQYESENKGGVAESAKEKPRSTRGRKPASTATAKKPTTAKPRKTATDIEKAKAEIKAKTGKTEAECESIIEQYRALRTKAQEGKRKAEQASADNKERVGKLERKGDIIEGTNEKTADAVIESTAKDVAEKIEKEVEAVEEKAEKEAKAEVAKDKTIKTPKAKKEAIEAKVEEQVKKKTETIVKRVVIDTSALLTSIATSLGKFDKDSQKEFLIKLRSDIDKLLSKYAFGGMTDGAVQVMNVQQSNLSASSVNPTLFAGGGGVKSADSKKIIESISEIRYDSLPPINERTMSQSAYQKILLDATKKAIKDLYRYEYYDLHDIQKATKEAGGVYNKAFVALYGEKLTYAGGGGVGQEMVIAGVVHKEEPNVKYYELLRKGAKEIEFSHPRGTIWVLGNKAYVASGYSLYSFNKADIPKIKKAYKSGTYAGGGGVGQEMVIAGVVHKEEPNVKYYELLRKGAKEIEFSHPRGTIWVLGNKAYVASGYSLYSFNKADIPKIKKAYKSGTYAGGGGVGRYSKIDLLVKKPYGNEEMEIAKFKGTGDAIISASALNENSPSNYEYSVRNSKKYANGGVVGQEIVFDYQGEEKTGVIKEIHENTGDYIVNTDDGRTILAQRDRDVISLGGMRKAVPMEAKKKRFGFFEGGGGVGKKFNYEDVLEVIQDQLEDSIDDLPSDFENSYNYKGEEVEHESRDGFIPYTDGGYEVRWFEYISGFSGAGYSLPTKSLQNEMQRQVDYQYETAKQLFSEEYPEIVEELGEENIDYNSLQEAGYESEAEELSEMEMNYDGDDTIMCEIGAYYYSPSNDRGIDGKHTLRLFGLVNLESPYHRSGNLEDRYDIDITFNSIPDLYDKVEEGLKEITEWFNGSKYNESTKELRINRMSTGGKLWIDTKKKGGTKGVPASRKNSFRNEAIRRGITSGQLASRVLANPKRYKGINRKSAQLVHNMGVRKKGGSIGDVLRSRRGM